MNWYKGTKTDLIARIKNILKTHPFTSKLMDYYNISPDDVDSHLEIEFVQLSKEFANGNGKKISIDSDLLTEDFIEKHFHFVVHEFFHWLKRRSEHNFYFNDPEEIQSFVLAITWELVNKKSKEEIYKTIYPIIQAHFKSDKESVRVFEDMYHKAVGLFGIYRNSV